MGLLFAVSFSAFPVAKRVGGTLQVGEPGIGTGRPEGLPQGPPIGLAMQRTKKYRTGGGRPPILRVAKPASLMCSDRETVIRHVEIVKPLLLA